MPDILDIFNDDAFGVVSLTAAINKAPFVPGQIGASGIFAEEGVDVTTIAIESWTASSRWWRRVRAAAPARRSTRKSATRARSACRISSATTPSWPRKCRACAPSARQRARGGAEPRSTRAWRAMPAIFDTTLEHQRVGAIKGIVVDKNADTMINLFTEFGVSAPADINFHLDVDTTKVRSICSDVILAVEDALDATSYTGIRGYCGKTFWKNFIDHKQVRETYLNTAQAAELRGDAAGVYDFEYGGITFTRYRTGSKAAAANAAGAAFIADNECRFVVEGVPTSSSPGSRRRTMSRPSTPSACRATPSRSRCATARASSSRCRPTRSTSAPSPACWCAASAPDRNFSRCFQQRPPASAPAAPLDHPGLVGRDRLPGLRRAVGLRRSIPGSCAAAASWWSTRRSIACRSPTSCSSATSAGSWRTARR
jgi:hypothetical protein